MESSKLLIFVFILLKYAFLVAGTNEKCITQKQEEGFCVPILRCESLVEILKSVHQTPTNRDYLISSRCDNNTDTKNVFVCCPKMEFLPALSVCGLQIEDRIISGDVAAIDEFRWIVQLIYLHDGEQKSVCNGVLINKDHVITAAQCVDSQKLQTRGLKLDSVRLGEWNTSTENDCECGIYIESCDCADPIVDIKIAENIIHDVADIAVIRLSKKIEKYTDFIAPICLPLNNPIRSESKEYATKSVSVSGWGNAEKGFAKDVKIKRRLNLVRDSECVEIYKANGTDVDPTRQICAGGLNLNDGCIGYPGTPLMFVDGITPNWLLVGILSSVPEECNAKGLPGIYTRVSGHTDWIVNQLMKKSLH